MICIWINLLQTVIKNESRYTQKPMCMNIIVVIIVYTDLNVYIIT